MYYRLILSLTFLNLLSYKTYSAKHNSIDHKQKAEKKTQLFLNCISGTKIKHIRFYHILHNLANYSKIRIII